MLLPGANKMSPNIPKLERHEAKNCDTKFGMVIIGGFFLYEPPHHCRVAAAGTHWLLWFDHMEWMGVVTLHQVWANVKIIRTHGGFRWKTLPFDTKIMGWCKSQSARKHEKKQQRKPHAHFQITVSEAINQAILFHISAASGPHKSKHGRKQPRAWAAWSWHQSASDT